MKERNLSLEFQKFLAVILVANSHMDVLYGKYEYLATGGAIGDALFFFVSGFTVFLGWFGRFDNWYKRRIKRIFPSLFAWAMMLSFFGIKQITISEMVCGGGYWFISCIMLYYVALWFVRRFTKEKPLIPFAISSIIILVWYFFEDRGSVFMYGNTYFKWGFNFVFMLAGAYVGNNTIKLKSSPIMDAVLLALSIVLYYGILWFVGHSNLVCYQLLSLIPLMGVIIYTYKLCIAEWSMKLMGTRFGNCLRFISGLCLEAYLVQVTIIPIVAETSKLTFPINAIIALFIVIVTAYFIRCLGRIFLQIFQVEDMDWAAVFRPIN